MRLLLDAFRPGATSIGWVFPFLVAIVAVAVIATMFGQVVLPWAIYPAL